MATQPNPTGPAPNANRISIVTKSEIRYEGILYHINPQDQNITLCNVKSFGTEGRRPGDEIAPSPQVHEYIIFRGTDIKDLKVIEGGQQTQPEAPTTNTQPTQPVGQTAPKEQPRHEEKQQEQKMVQGQDDFDFQGMQEKFHQAALEHKQPEITSKSYSQKDFFDSLSTSTAEKTREAPFDRIAQKKVDKETFGSEYVDNASHRGGRGGRGGYKRGGGGNYRGGQNRRYQGGEGGQNRNYGGQNRYQNRQGQGGYNNYNQGGGRYQQGGDNNYQGGSRYQQGGDNNYQGGGRYQQGGDNNYQGGSRYQQGGDNNYQGGSRYQQGGDNYNQGGGRYQQNSGPRYYKTYQNVNQDQTQGGEDDKGFRKY